MATQAKNARALPHAVLYYSRWFAGTKNYKPRFTEVREHVWSTLMDEAREAELKLEH